MAQSTGSYDFEKDIAELTEAIQTNPTHDAFAIRGMAFYRMGQLLKAQADFDRAIELKPDFDYYYYWRGSVFFARGQYDDASAAFRRASQLDPSRWFYQKVLGDALYVQGHREEAILCYEKALELARQDGQVSKEILKSLEGAKQGTLNPELPEPVGVDD